MSSLIDTSVAVPTTIPVYGGRVTMANGKEYRLVNTCNIDNWLAFFALHQDVCDRVMQSVNDLTKTVENRSWLTSILELCKRREFTPAKMFLAHINGIKFQNKMMSHSSPSNRNLRGGC